MGLTQVTRGNWKAYGGGADPMDPAANIDVGARILAESIKMAHGDITGGLQQYNGHSDAGYVGKVNAYYQPNLGTGQYRPIAGPGADTKTTASWDQQRLLDTANVIAQSMHVSGVTGAQIMRGAYTQGDVNIGYQRAMSSAKIAFMNAYQASQAGGMNPVQRQNAMIALRSAALNERNLESYGSQVMGRATAGGQTSLTQGQTIAIGSPNISVNINSVKGFDEKEFRRRIDDVLAHHMALAINAAVDGEKA
jgi:hypothetical protein